MPNHERLDTDSFDERGRNQYQHYRDVRRRDTDASYEERNYGRSKPGEQNQPTYAASDRIGAYGQDDQSYPNGRRNADYRGYSGSDDSYRGGRSQTDQYEYYRRDNAQFRGYPDDNDRRRDASYNEERESSPYVNHQHQRPGGFTPRAYDRDDARVHGHEASRGRDQYSRSYSDRGHDPYQNGYDQGSQARNRQDDDRRYGGREDREDRRGDRDNRNSREEFGFGNDYSSSLYDDNSRNRTNRGHDHQEERQDRRGQDERHDNRRWTDSPDLDNRSYR